MARGCCWRARRTCANITCPTDSLCGFPLLPPATPPATNLQPHSHSNRPRQTEEEGKRRGEGDRSGRGGGGRLEPTQCSRAAGGSGPRGRRGPRETSAGGNGVVGGGGGGGGGGAQRHRPGARVVCQRRRMHTHTHTRLCVCVCVCVCVYARRKGVDTWVRPEI